MLSRVSGNGTTDVNNVKVASVKNFTILLEKKDYLYQSKC